MQSPELDINSDGVVSPIDALIVINYLNRLSRGLVGEGEADSESPSIQSGTNPIQGEAELDEQLLNSMAADLVDSWNSNRRVRPALLR